ncbi:DUF6318 family protein [Arthrobacter antioxidans]|uniref:DUF6318 family protein n=1 Tax=Arthrobacter antioxidans TaxID=2895818 RepID=UPI001FFEA88D|nr:DUF6318 family protein [Arthrobacter antioxidans]
MFPVRAESRRRSAPILAGAAAALVLLTGCQNDADAAPGRTSAPPSSSAAPTAAEASARPSATPEPSPASSAGPAANIPVPVKPALADENTPEGLEAFTEYWFELLSYSYITNDWKQLDEKTDSGCRTCSSIKSAVNELYGQGRWVRGAEVQVISFDTTFESTTSGSITAYVENRQSKIEYFDKDGSVLRTVPTQDPPAFDVINALYEEGKWIILDYGAPEGTS